jgi:hypothetical protein
MAVASTPKKLATAALENNPDITIVKQENTVPISNHEQDDDGDDDDEGDDDDSAPSSVATNNNGENSDIEVGDGQETNGTHHDDGKQIIT